VLTLALGAGCGPVDRIRERLFDGPTPRDRYIQMLDWAGAEDRNSKHGTDSVRIPWERVLEYQPEVVIVSPCGFKTDKALEQSIKLMERPGWNDLPAVKQGKVFAVDANAYFARPGPRIVEGVELLAHLIHPEDFHWAGSADAYRRVHGD